MKAVVLPKLLRLVTSGVFDPSVVLTQQIPMSSAIEAYKEFDKRTEGGVKVELQPSLVLSS